MGEIGEGEVREYRGDEGREEEDEGEGETGGR